MIVLFLTFSVGVGAGTVRWFGANSYAVLAIALWLLLSGSYTSPTHP